MTEKDFYLILTYIEVGVLLIAFIWAIWKKKI